MNVRYEGRLVLRCDIAVTFDSEWTKWIPQIILCVDKNLTYACPLKSIV